MAVFTSHLPDYYNTLKLAQRIRSERRRKRLTLQEVARASKISSARLSQIENGRFVVDVSQAFAIASALGVTLECLFPPDTTVPYQITREADLRASPDRETYLVSKLDGGREKHHNTFWPLAELFIGRHFEPLLGRITPLRDENLQFNYHHEHEFAFILHGDIEFLIKTPQGLRHEQLSRGDCMYFRSNLPHCLRSLGSEPSESLHVLWSASATVQTGLAWLSPHTVQWRDYGKDNPNSAELVGKELSSLRAAHGWTVEETSAFVGLRGKRYEKMERGERPLPLDVMFKLARAFGKRPGELIGYAQEPGPYYCVQRSEEIHGLPPRKLRMPVEEGTGKTAVFYPLARDFPKKHIYPYFVKVPNIHRAMLKPHEHSGHEFIYVLDGKLELTTYAEEQEVRELLEPGDSCYFDSSVPHLLRGETRNPYSETSAELIAIFWCPLGEGYLFET